MKEVENDVFIHRIQCDAKQGDNHQLDRAYFSQEGTVGNQNGTTAEIRID